MQGLRSALKEATWVFGLSRLIILLISYISVIQLPPLGQSTALNCAKTIGPCILAWYHYDAVAYVSIAFKGYSYTPDTAFFPFWPLIIHIGGILLGSHIPMSYYLASVFLANVCFYFALVLLYYLLSEDFEPTLARRALFYFSFSPYALFFFAGYTESLFVLLTVAIFLLLRRGKPIDFWLAGLLGFLATLTRSSGIILAVPFLVVYLQRFWLASRSKPEPESDSNSEASPQPQINRYGWLLKLTTLAPVVLIPAGVLAYMIYLYYTKGNPLIFMSEEVNYVWHRHFTFPWNAFSPPIGVLLTTPLFTNAFMQNLLDLAFTILALGTLILGWKRIPLHYSLFALALALFTLSFPTAVASLTSQERYLLTLFPIFVIFALWGKRPRFDLAYIALSLPLLGLNVIFFTHHFWVA